ncbi:hypothetical protein E2C01_007567 [Portunus trituberculatus]|uniref:Uncharacterized protein n=1 Tax=Portunus trituberculatus TaxID=210409 RepID=A0A5B7CYH9_PORTR|nr:hypothetical protein [Portunus trituberculatus]
MSVALPGWDHGSVGQASLGIQMGDSLAGISFLKTTGDTTREEHIRHDTQGFSLSMNTTPFKGDSKHLKSVMFTSDYTRISSDGGSSAAKWPCLTPTHCTAGVAARGVATPMQDTPRSCSR